MEGTMLGLFESDCPSYVCYVCYVCVRLCVSLIDHRQPKACSDSYLVGGGACIDRD